MADEFSVGEGWTVVLDYKKQGGDIGSLDLTDPFVVNLTTPGIAAATVSAFDPVKGEVTVNIDHNGGVGDFVASMDVDGDLLPGDNHKFPIHWEHAFTALPPLGSTGVTETATRRPTPPTP